MLKNNKKILSENKIIYKYLSKLNFNKKETFNFKNDGGYLNSKKSKKIVVTNDTIAESIDFFKDDPADSIAQKILTYNLSDLSALGATPYCYTLSLSLPDNIGSKWIIKFSNKLFYLQKKYNIFLLGGDICKSKNLNISANFFGYSKKNSILQRGLPKINDTIWVTGNIGDSYVGLLLKQKKLNIDKKFQKYFLNKYLYPEPSLLGFKLSNFSKNAIDISDGFFGDLSKLLNSSLGADISLSKIPISKKAKYLISQNIVNLNDLLFAGDDYELIFTASGHLDAKIQQIAKDNNCKITKVGRIIPKKGIFIDGLKSFNSISSFQYFF